MPRGNRLFVGQKVRQLRLDGRLDQVAMARLLGISVSYLSQLENNDRPLTARVKAALAAAFPLDWADFDERPEEQLLGAFNWALANPGHGSPPPDPERTERLHIQYPDFAARYVELHHTLRQTEQRLARAQEALGADLIHAARTPWEQVSDWFHDTDNYVHDLDITAEDLAARLGLGEGDASARLIEALARDHHCDVHVEPLEPTLLRAFSADERVLRLNAALPAPGMAFQLASQLALLDLSTEARHSNPVADGLLRHALINYAAAALLMPYRAFREAARALRHDVDALAARFGVSAEQVCHRLATLQRPGLRGVPFFFCRIDMAGNLIKRHSATRLQFGRFGNPCPLWNAHEAAGQPGRTLVQLTDMPDGLRYVSLARGIGKPARRYAVALVCESIHASHLAYADGLDLTDEAAATPIGPGCRLCPREGCAQRAFPPLDRPIHVEGDDERHIVPYRIG